MVLVLDLAEWGEAALPECLQNTFLLLTSCVLLLAHIIVVLVPVFVVVVVVYITLLISAIIQTAVPLVRAMLSR